MNIRHEIQLWLGELTERSGLSTDQAEELESHLLDSIDALTASGLREDEAYLIAVRRLGSVGELAPAQVRREADRVWKDLFEKPRRGSDERFTDGASSDVGSSDGALIDGASAVGAAADGAPTGGASARGVGVSRGLWDWIRSVDRITVALFAGVALLALMPQWLGYNLDDDPVYLMNVTWMVLPMAALFYLRRDWAHGERPSKGSVAARFAVLMIPAVVNAYPFAGDGQTLAITMLHLPLLGWLALALFRDPDVLRGDEARMDYIRFTGETLVYCVLVGLSVLALTGLAGGLFSLLGVDIEPFFESWVIPLIFPLTLLTGIVLVERKRSLVENFAPVLARIIAPLLLAVLGTFTVMLLASEVFGQTDREVLLIMDLVLLAVVMVVIYGVSTRPEMERRPFQDVVGLLLVAVAMVSDAYALGSMVLRIAEFGVSANKVTALGANVLLMGNLAILLLYFVRQLRSGVSPRRMLSIQGAYFGVYWVWFAVAALVFPWAFGFA